MLCVAVGVIVYPKLRKNLEQNKEYMDLKQNKEKDSDQNEDVDTEPAKSQLFSYLWKYHRQNSSQSKAIHNI